MLILKSEMSIAQISQKSRVDPRQIWELRHRNYKNGPRIGAIKRLAPVLGVSVEQLTALVCANTPAAQDPQAAQAS